MNSPTSTETNRKLAQKTKSFLSFGKKRKDDDDDDDIQGGLGAVAVMRAMFPNFAGVRPGAVFGGPAVA